LVTRSRTRVGLLSSMLSASYAGLDLTVSVFDAKRWKEPRGIEVYFLYVSN